MENKNEEEDLICTEDVVNVINDVILDCSAKIEESFIYTDDDIFGDGNLFVGML